MIQAIDLASLMIHEFSKKRRRLGDPPKDLVSRTVVISARAAIKFLAI